MKNANLGIKTAPSEWLLIDVSYLAYRNFHAMGQLSHDGLGTAVPYGIFRDVSEIKDRFGIDNVIFAFDRGEPKRKIWLPSYKSGRRKRVEESEELQIARKELHRQIKRLHRELLPLAGYRNVLSADGFEADDIIAKIVDDHPKYQFVIVSADSDLYQLLGKNVSIWNPSRKKVLTDKWFRDTYGISPSQWSDVKAIAGCDSDNVPGVSGVGDKTAVKFLTGALSSGKVFEKIVHNHQLWENNLRLVRLPFKGTPRFKLVRDEVTPRSEKSVFDSLGIHSIRTR